MNKLTYTLLAACLMLSQGSDLYAAKKSGAPRKAMPAREIKHAPAGNGWSLSNVFWGLEKTNEYKPKTKGLYKLSPRGTYAMIEGTEKVKANVAGWMDAEGHYYGFDCINETSVNMSGQYQTTIQSTLTEYDPANAWSVVSTNNFDKRKVFYALSAAHNPADGKIYGCFYNPEAEAYEYAVVDPATKTKTVISDLEYDWIAVFFDDKGTLYYIDEYYYLGTVDLETGETTDIEYTGVEKGYYSCAAYDTRSGKAYWTTFDFNSMSEKPICSTVYMVDLESAETVKLFDVDNMDSLNGIFVPAQTAVTDAPDFVTGIDLTNAGTTGKLAFTMPASTVGGEALTGKGTYHFVANDVELATGEAEFGSKVEVDVTFPGEATYMMSLYASNEVGNGREATDMKFVGADTPLSPENVKAKWDKGVFTVTWDAVSGTINHSIIDPEEVTYTVTRYPGEVVVATDIKETSFSETLYPEADATYHYAVTAKFGSKESEAAASNEIELKGMAQNDVELTGLDVPARVFPGREFVVTATVKNVGVNEATGVKVNLYRNDVLVDTKEVAPLKYDDEAQVAFDQQLTILDNPQHQYRAEAVLENDNVMDNNVSENVDLTLRLSKAPVVDNAAAAGAEGVTLTWTAPALTGDDVVKEITDDFENYPAWSYENIGDWTLDDRDENQPYPDVYFPFGPFEEEFPPMAFCVFDNTHPDLEDNDDYAAYSGNKFLAALSSDSGQNDDWLISPELPLGGQTISLYARSRIGAKYAAETFEVLASTNGMKFNLVKQFAKISNKWEEYIVELPADARYFAIRSVSDYCDMLFVDDVTYTRKAQEGDYALVGYNIYRDGVKLNETPVEATTYVDGTADGGKHTYAVTAVYADDESRPVNVEVAGEEKAAYTVTPEAGATVKNIYKVTFTPGEGVANFSYDMTGSTKAYFNVDGAFFCDAECAQSMEDFLSMEVTPECFIYTAGECELVVEPGFFTWKDAAGKTQSNTEALTYKYTVEGGTDNPTDLPIVVTPVEGSTVEALENVTVQFGEGYTLMPLQSPSMVYFAQDGIKTSDAVCTLGTDGRSFTIVPANKLTQDGLYDLVIMTFGLQYLDSEYNYLFNAKPLVYSYTVKAGSGIENIFTNNEGKDAIYNLQGVRMLGPVNTLAPGIYIMNGQKIIVR